MNDKEREIEEFRVELQRQAGPEWLYQGGLVQRYLDDTAFLLQAMRSAKYEQEEVQRRYIYLQERLWEAEKIIEAMVDEEEPECWADGIWYCWYCEAIEPTYLKDHGADCSYRRAAEYMEKYK